MVTRILLLFFLLQGISLHGQHVKSDTSFLASAITKTVAVYSNAMQGQAGLYNGTGYLNYESLQPGEHPYFSIDDWSLGNIHYDGEDFHNVFMMYDLFRDKVILEHYYNHELIELINIKVTRFSLLNHTFVHLLEDKKNNIREGFYDSLYSGKTKVYAKYDKTLQKDVKNENVTYFFSSSTSYYISKDGIYYPVYNKASVLDVFRDRKKEVKQFLNRSKIHFNKNREKAIAQMARFYDSQ